MSYRNAIPVVLQFSNVASNSYLNITLTTPGARWSMGGRIGDSLGFSYNVLAQDVYGNVPVLQSVSFNGGILEIRTSSVAPALNKFSLTLFLDIEPDVPFLQGYCTLNNEAVVSAFLGGEQPVQWYNGRISAVLPAAPRNCRSVLFTISGLQPGSPLMLDVIAGAPGSARWTLGPEVPQALGAALSSTGGNIPLASFTYNDKRIVMQTGNGQGGTLSDVLMVAYVSWQPADLSCIYLKAIADPSVSVCAQVGTRQPQWISPTYSVFTL
ncbi:hypothetical protein EO087_14305 [Dyella sp. M7H15-1]|uniref:hypothetical protein n=1 Tax=Dyella sp. M7H15-1 TaxID=2501295 RepID=UPI001004D6E5|nr:hypothetical protein [Dyella sp. M7H15-1]QAU25021.1 hypothetical protein EO087_14305 [Dyella sp. M7H15-1]